MRVLQAPTKVRGLLALLVLLWYKSTNQAEDKDEEGDAGSDEGTQFTRFTRTLLVQKYKSGSGGGGGCCQFTCFTIAKKCFFTIAKVLALLVQKYEY